MTSRDLSGALIGWLERLMPDGERRERLAALLHERFGADAREAGGEVCAEMQAVARTVSRHLDVEWVPEGGLVLDADPPGWPPQDPQEVAARGASITARTVDGAGVPTGQNALYITDGRTGVYATTVTMTPLVRFWWSPATSAQWTKR